MNKKEKQAEKMNIKRHSMAHILATAMLEMFPETKFGIGPATDDGFYYDFDLPRTLIPEDLEILEDKMKKIIKENYKFKMKEMGIDDAIKHFKEANQLLKVELLENLKNDGESKVSVYKSGPLVDLCKGPHLDSTGEIDSSAFKLTRISGAYWLSDENKQQLQRVYGVVFNDKKALKQYLFQQEEAKKRDHKKIGQELDLFSFHQESPGSAFWHPKGMAVWNELEQFGKIIRKKYNYSEIQTPILAKNILWKTSGHWDHYREDMFYFDHEKDTYCLKPMDCPFNIKIYQTAKRSYRDLPIRYTEIGRVFRNEQSGELNGLLRVQHITQDDSHVFVRHSQIKQEISALLKMTKEYYRTFNIEPEFFLSTRPDNFMGEIVTWDKAEKDLEEALNSEKINYTVKDKDGAFYGPKIDIDIKDALGRRWQVATIQLDFQLPGKFNAVYTDEKGNEVEPALIHAAIFGSFERFIGIITEHYAGAFPLWLAPVQIGILPVSEKFTDYAEKVNSRLEESDIRTEMYNQDEGLGKRIALATKQKIPYLLILGEKEVTDETVTIRQRGNKKQQTIAVSKFIKMLQGEIGEKK
jgi:threonyl-tRNA synthetase